MKLIEGDVKPGDSVEIVDDLITTGGSTIQAIQSAKEGRLKIVKVIVLVDRQERNERQKILQEIPEAEFFAIFTLSEIAGRGLHEGSCRKGTVRGESSGTHAGL